MPLESTGKKVLDIKYDKNKATIILDDGTKISSYNDILLEKLVYIGKVLSNDDIKEIVLSSFYDDCLKNALKRLSHYAYTVQELENKLIERYSKETVNRVIEYLSNNNLLDDDVYIKDYIFYGNSKLWGKEKIISKLLEKGIDKRNIKDAYFSMKVEEEKLSKLLPSLKEKYKYYNSKKKKEHIYLSLLRFGYDKEIISRFLNNIEMDIDGDFELLLKEYKKVKIKGLSKYEGARVNQYIVGTLLQKGYNYSDIKKIMEDDINDD